MRYVISGASGFVGKMLVPLLLERGCEMILIGRNKEKMKRLFPLIEVACYQNVGKKISAGDVVVNLAVANNDQNISIERTREVNVHLANWLASISAKAGAAHFINISNVHALSPVAKSTSARTKKEAVDRMSAVTELPGSHLFLPPIYGNKFSGKLKVLNILPFGVSAFFFVILRALKPTLNIEILAEWLCEESNQHEAKVILTDTQKDNVLFQSSKRLVDIFFCIFVVLFFGWLMILVGLAIRLTSPGPAIFKHTRAGQNGTLFTCFKFRSMTVDTLQLGTHEIGSEAITPVGKFIRKTKIDELPQIWNILANHMTLIGPRPCLPSQTRLLELRQIAQVDCLKPGISGLAQINGIDMSDPERLVKWDRRYLDLQCLTLDFQIALKTAIGRGQGDPAQRM